MLHRYYDKSDWYEDKIHSQSEILDLDHEFRDNHMDMLLRFYKVFEGITRYVQDLKQWLHELEEVSDFLKGRRFFGTDFA